MAEMTQAQAAQVQQICDLIESSRLRLKNIAKNLEVLVKAGRATCEELRAYNLWALAVYQTNKGQLQVARNAGATNLPILPPSPALFVYRGIGGQNAASFPCDNNPKTLSGALADALTAPEKGFFINPNAVEIIPAGAEIGPLPEGPSLRQIEQQLGVPLPWGAIIIVGLIVAGAATVAVFSYLETQSISERTAKVSDDNLKTFETAADLRAKCLQMCIDAGGSPESCIGKCSNVIPVPRAPGEAASSSGLGFWMWMGIGVAGIIGARYAYRRWQDKRATGGGLPADIGDDDDEDLTPARRRGI